MIELERCPTPWCGKPVRGFTTDHFGRFRAFCISCGVHGPIAETKELAAELWNTRPKSEAEELLEWLHERRGSLQCYAASSCVVDYPDSDYVTESDNPLDALRAAREASDE